MIEAKNGFGTIEHANRPVKRKPGGAEALQPLLKIGSDSLKQRLGRFFGYHRAALLAFDLARVNALILGGVFFSGTIREFAADLARYNTVTGAQLENPAAHGRKALFR